MGIFKKLHHPRPQTVSPIAHEFLDTSPEHKHGIPNKLENKLGDKTADKRKTLEKNRKHITLTRWETTLERRESQKTIKFIAFGFPGYYFLSAEQPEGSSKQDDSYVTAQALPFGKTPQNTITQ